MAAVPKGKVRRAQLVTTYGIGALVAIEDESFMVAGADRWYVRDSNINEPRLERMLGVRGFVLPPATEKGRDVPVVRFPEYYSCPACSRLERHKFFSAPDRNNCAECDLPLTPSRFVICCENGHIDDFPYFDWVHAGGGASGSTNAKHELRIRTEGTSAALRGILISCSCGITKSLDGAFDKYAMKQIGIRCRGSRPWLKDVDPVACDQLPRTAQRGASNVWFPVVYSSLSIPPWSEGAFLLLNRHWSVLKAIPQEAVRATIAALNISNDEYTADDLAEAVRQRKESETEGTASDGEALRAQEYDALLRGKPETRADQEFVCTPCRLSGGITSTFFQKIMAVKRLREVRALQSFTRLKPPVPGEPKSRRAALYSSDPNWLPAIEVRGEGVFFELKPDLLQVWEANPAVQARALQIQSSYTRALIASGGTTVRAVTPRFLLVHALAHALINQWSLDCGYPAASLRERLYVSDDAAGLLIYTATSDSAGSLGGIVSQAESSRLDFLLGEAVARASWCSSDPVCIEAEVSGVDALNLAACHACILLPEVSCEEMNRFLDRGMLIGWPKYEDLGFFSALASR